MYRPVPACPYRDTREIHAMTDDQHDWQLLLDIFYKLGRLDHPLYRRLTHDDYPGEYRLLALESAFRSGAIPMHGCRASALGSEATERIETKIDAETAIDITLDEVTLRNSFPDGREPIDIAVFKRVHADLASVERLLNGECEDALPVKGEEKADEKGMQGAIRQAAKELWPDDVPAGLLKKTRNDKIRAHLSKKKMGKPDDRTIRRAFGGK
jgi:hypothetical protein